MDIMILALAVIAAAVTARLAEYLLDLVLPQQRRTKHVIAIGLACVAFALISAVLPRLTQDRNDVRVDDSVVGLVMRQGEALIISLFTPTPTPTPSFTPTPTSSFTPTPTPSFTPTPTPSFTPTPTPSFTPTPTPSFTPTPTPLPPTQSPMPRSLEMGATNRGNLPEQGQDGWNLQYEQGRNAGSFLDFPDRRAYSGMDCYMSSRDDVVRICADGALHPGQQSRVAYRWNSNLSGAAIISVHARKIDTLCGDGIGVGVYIDESGQALSEIGEMVIGASDNNGQTMRFDVVLSPSTHILFITDMRANDSCDLSRVHIDIWPK